MKTTIFNKVNRIHGMQASILLITLLISIPMKSIAQQENPTLYAMAYNEMISETDSKIMNHILKEKALETKAESMKEAFDVENWMMDLSEWEESFSGNDFLDDQLQLENWMIHLEDWGEKFYNADQKKTSMVKVSANDESRKRESMNVNYFEEALNLEKWMMEPYEWDLIKYDNVAEPSLELEGWMTDLSEWK